MAVATETQFHVLAVDDSIIDRKLIERLLRISSFQVTAVESGSKALELLGLREDLKSPPSAPPYQNEIDVNLVITDYSMPGMTGYDLLRKIKESSALKDIPVVIMSSENVPSRINRVISLLPPKECKFPSSAQWNLRIGIKEKCLEEGAEEFLLKPVKQSDMNKLMPRILKGKSKENQLENNTNNGFCKSCSTFTSENTIDNMKSTNTSGNKRKAMDEGFSPERRKPRLSSSNISSNWQCCDI